MSYRYPLISYFIFVSKPAVLAKNHRPTDLVSHFGVLCQERQIVLTHVTLPYDFKRLGRVKKKELFKNLNSETCLFCTVPEIFHIIYRIR